jgi:hypothetical protein
VSYQPGQRNFTVRTGADNIFAVRFHRQTGLVAAVALVAGDFVVQPDRIWPVFSTTPAGTGKVTIKLGHGAHYEPELTLLDDDQVPVAPAAAWEEIDMQVTLPDTATTPPPATLTVPTTITGDDDEVCLINIGQTWLEPFQQAIDYSAGGPSGMSLPYDLVGRFDGQRIAVLTGVINIVRSAASPVVAPPVEVLV